MVKFSDGLMTQDKAVMKSTIAEKAFNVMIFVYGYLLVSRNVKLLIKGNNIAHCMLKTQSQNRAHNSRYGWFYVTCFGCLNLEVQLLHKKWIIVGGLWFHLGKMLLKNLTLAIMIFVFIDSRNLKDLESLLVVKLIRRFILLSLFLWKPCD